MSTYKIEQDAGGKTGNNPVTRYEDLVKHHPRSGKESGRSYKTAHGKLEEISSENKNNIKKDFILTDDKGSRNVLVPSPVNGYATYDKNYGTINIYDKEKGKDKVLLAKLHHIKPGTATFTNGAKVEYGQGLGTQHGTGENGIEKYAIHSHVETDEETYKKYIADIASGKIKVNMSAEEAKVRSTASNGNKEQSPNHQKKDAGAAHAEVAPASPAPSNEEKSAQTRSASNTPKVDSKNANGALARLISKGEGDYQSFNKGKAGDSINEKIDFSQMTLAEIRARQGKKKGDKDRLFAIGRYQITPDTLQEAIHSLKLKGTEKFTPELQDKIFSEYLIKSKRKGINKAITSENLDNDTLDAALLELAKEWASIAAPNKNGSSYYDKKAGNKAHISTEEAKTALLKTREDYKKLLAQGLSKDDARRMAVLGNMPASSNTSPSESQGISAAQAAKKNTESAVKKNSNDAKKQQQEAEAKIRKDEDAKKKKDADDKRKKEEEEKRKLEAEKAQAKQQAEAKKTAEKADQPATSKQTQSSSNASQSSGPGNLDAQLVQLSALINQLSAALAPLSQPIQIVVDVQNGNLTAAVNNANQLNARRS